MADVLKPEGLSDENWTRLKDKISWPFITTVDGGLRLTSWVQLDAIINLAVAAAARAQGPAIDSEDVANLRDALVNMAGLLREMDRVAPAPGSNHEPVANIMERAASAIGRLMAERRINAIARAQGPGEAVAWRYRFRSQWALSGWSYVDGPERPDLNEWDGFSGYEVEPLYAATPTREA